MTPDLWFLCSRVRAEEKLLLEALDRRGASVERLDPRGLQFAVDALPAQSDEPLPLVWDRELAFHRGRAVVSLLASRGHLCVNRPAVVDVCGDKMRTHLALAAAGVPAPRTRVAFTAEGALEALEEIGWPAVLKPVVGSWGRLLARVRDRDAAEAVLEHRTTLGDAGLQTVLVQEHVEKPGRDLRVFVAGDEPLAAIARRSEHWITNTARGAEVEGLPLDDELAALALAAARAVGGGLLAIDLVETQAGERLVLEVNHGMEFRNSIVPTGVDLPGRMAAWVLAQCPARAQEACA